MEIRRRTTNKKPTDVSSQRPRVLFKTVFEMKTVAPYKLRREIGKLERDGFKRVIGRSKPELGYDVYGDRKGSYRRLNLKIHQ